MNALACNGIAVEVTINGRPVRTYPHQGKYFFESRKDSQYEIVVRNNNAYRVEVVAAVDGLSVLTGKLASKSDSGYIVNGYDKVVIKGYRCSDDSVGAFKFTEKYGSYAASKGIASNTGIIAVAVFQESIPTQYWSTCGSYPAGSPCIDYNRLIGAPLKRHSDFFYTTDNAVLRGYTGNPGPNGSIGVVGSNGIIGCSTTDMMSFTNTCQTSVADEVPAAHGTGWGDKLDDKVKHVTWVRGAEIYSSELHYNSRENLIALGVEVIPEKRVAKSVGFPGDYATPPIGWRG